jgi:hypothetical protein
MRRRSITPLCDTRGTRLPVLEWPGLRELGGRLERARRLGWRARHRELDHSTDFLPLAIDSYFDGTVRKELFERAGDQFDETEQMST